MKKTRKLFALLLAVVMMMGLGVTASAATITIDNPAEDETYTAYKLFDVSNEGNAYSYSTTNKNLVDALSNKDANLEITFTKAASRDVWYVSGLDANEDAATLAQYIHTHWSDTFETLLGDGIKAQSVNVAEPGEEAQYEMQIDTGNETGYYFVTSSLGSLCALNTTTATANVQEKNTIPSVTKKVREDSAAADSEWKESATIDIVDTVDYKLTVNTGTNSANLGTGVDGNYVIVDELPDGITYQTGSIAVAVGQTSWNVTSDYTVNYDPIENELTITLLAAGKLSGLAQKTDIIITYKADVDGDVVTHGYVATNNPNHVTLSYKEQTSEDYAYVYTFDIGGADQFKKVDADDHEKELEDVTFVLSKMEEDVTYYAQVDQQGYLAGWTENDEDENIKLSTNSEGTIFVKGLDAGEYLLTEIATQPGYNLLKDTITVKITETGEITYKLTSSDGNGAGAITVENETGTELPSTGGMGTTLIYIAGAVLVIGAGVLLVVRRRMNAER